MFEGGLAELHTHLGGSVASDIMLATAVKVLESTQAYDCLVCAARTHPKLLAEIATIRSSIDLPAILREARNGIHSRARFFWQ